jgi:integrase/recombinase XerC
MNAEELIYAFEKSVKATRANRTAKSYAQGARKFEKYLEDANCSLDDAPPGLMGNFVQWMVQDERLEPASVKLFSIGAARYLDYRRNQGETLPAFGKPDLPKVPEHEVEVLTRDQVMLYLGIISGNILEPSRTALLLLPYTGLRSGEMAAMKLTNIGTGKDKGKKDHLLFDFAGKGSKRRKVPIADRGKKILRDYLGDWLEGFNEKNPKNQYLFPGRSGGHISPRTLRDSFSFVRDKLGMATMTPHVLRKTYCTELIRSGFNIATVAEVMGHSSIQTTHKYYTAIKNEDLMEVGNLNNY